MRVAARVSDSSSTSIVNRIEPSSTRIGPIFTIRRCADQNLSPLTLIQSKSRATLSRDPAIASFRNDQTLNLNSTIVPYSRKEPAANVPVSHHRTTTRTQTRNVKTKNIAPPQPRVTTHSTTVGIDCKAHHTSSPSPETQPNSDRCSFATTPPTTRSAIIYYTPRNSRPSPAFSERKRNVA